MGKNSGKDNNARDFDDMLAGYYRCFLVKDGVLYCKDYINKIVVVWTGTKWALCPRDLPEGYSDVKPDVARKMAACPPWDFFDELMHIREEAQKAKWENLFVRTAKRVIGYTNTAFGSDAFMPIESSALSEEEYAAIVKDFRERGYFFTGEDYQDSPENCTPVLENYRYVDFSRRGFAALIAKVLGDFSQMAYCDYTESIFYDEDRKVYPDEGLYPDVPRAAKTIRIDDDTYRQLAAEAHALTGKLIALSVPKEERGFFWENDTLTLLNNEICTQATVVAIGIFRDKADYDMYREYRDVDCTPWREEYAGSTILLVKPCRS